jgi:hypothetical protein
MYNTNGDSEGCASQKILVFRQGLYALAVLSAYFSCLFNISKRFQIHKGII